MAYFYKTMFIVGSCIYSSTLLYASSNWPTQAIQASHKRQRLESEQACESQERLRLESERALQKIHDDRYTMFIKQLAAQEAARRKSEAEKAEAERKKKNANK